MSYFFAWHLFSPRAFATYLLTYLLTYLIQGVVYVVRRLGVGCQQPSYIQRTWWWVWEDGDRSDSIPCHWGRDQWNDVVISITLLTLLFQHSGTVRLIFAKFGTMAHIGPPKRTGSWNLLTFKNSRWRTAAILKNGKSAIEQDLLMRRPVHVKSAILRVGKSRIICYVI